jgi:hypothetical protein
MASSRPLGGLLLAALGWHLGERGSGLTSGVSNMPLGWLCVVFVWFWFWCVCVVVLLGTETLWGAEFLCRVKFTTLFLETLLGGVYGWAALDECSRDVYSYVDTRRLRVVGRRPLLLLFVCLLFWYAVPSGQGLIFCPPSGPGQGALLAALVARRGAVLRLLG